MGPLDLIPVPYRLIAAIGAAAAVAAAGAWFVHHERDIGRTEGRGEIQAKWNAAVKLQQDQAIAEAASNARETQRRLERQKESQDAYDQDLAAARMDAASAAVAVDRVRRRAQQLAAASCRAGGDPAAGLDGAAAAAAPGVLADVLGKAVDRSRLLAAYAQAARRTGLQCERDYDSLAGAVKPPP